MSEHEVTDDLVLYHSAISPCAQKVRLVLEEKSLTYESRLINIVAKENLEPWYLRMNPQGEVPTLSHLSRVIVESTLICDYLDQVFPSTRILFGDPFAIYRSRLVAKWVDEKLHPALGAIAWSVALRRQFMEKGMESAIAAINRVEDPVRRGRQLRILEQGFASHDVTDAVETYFRLLGKFNDMLEVDPWLAGTQFSLADIALIPYVQALHQYALDSIFLQKFDQLQRWFDRVRERESFPAAITDFIPADRRDLMLRYGLQSQEAISELVPPL